MFYGTNTHFDKKMDMLEMAINASTIRRDVIADNIANADTPFFKRSEVTFESELQRAVESENEPQFKAVLTDPRHISFDEVIDYKNVKPKISVEYDSNYRNDKNNVDIDKEMTDSTKNALQYNAFLEIYSRNIKIIDYVMK